MPHSWQYPRWRRILMQITLWLLFGGTIGLAALVTRQRNAPLQITLSQQIQLGPLTLHLPANWIISDPTGDGSVAIARESDVAGQDRTLIARVRPVTGNISAANYLIQSGLLRHTYAEQDQTDSPDDPADAAPQASSLPMKGITIAGAPGIMLNVLRPRTRGPQEPGIEVHEEFIACAILPSKIAIILRLDCPTRGDVQASELLRQIAAASTINKIPEPSTPPPEDAPL